MGGVILALGSVAGNRLRACAPLGTGLSVFGAPQRAGGGRIAALSILAALGLAGSATSALAKPPAPGAPGAVHTWAPADKHGFGTSEQLASDVHFTLRAASLTDVYFPDLNTPSLRGLQFAVTDGASFLDRETVDDDPGHIEPVAPAPRATHGRTSRLTTT